MNGLEYAKNVLGHLSRILKVEISHSTITIYKDGIDREMLPSAIWRSMLFMVYGIRLSMQISQLLLVVQRMDEKPVPEKELARFIICLARKKVQDEKTEAGDDSVAQITTSLFNLFLLSLSFEQTDWIGIGESFMEAPDTATEYIERRITDWGGKMLDPEALLEMAKKVRRLSPEQRKEYLYVQAMLSDPMDGDQYIQMSFSMAPTIRGKHLPN